MKQWKNSDMRVHINTLKAFEGAGVAAAKALSDIQERQLYKEHYDSVNEFAEKELGWTKRRFYQLLDYHKIKEALPARSEPLVHSERQTRALKSVPEEKRAQVLEEAAKSGKVTSQSIKEAVAKVIPMEVIDQDQVGHDIPTPAQETWNRRAEMQEFLHQISKMRSWAEKMQKTKDHFFAEVSFQELLSDCNNIYSNLKGAVPYSICGVCQGQAPKTCKLCNGRGMISKFSWDHHVGAQQKQMMKRKSDDITKVSASA